MNVDSPSLIAGAVGDGAASVGLRDAVSHTPAVGAIPAALLRRDGSLLPVPPSGVAAERGVSAGLRSPARSLGPPASQPITASAPLHSTLRHSTLLSLFPARLNKV